MMRLALAFCVLAVPASAQDARQHQLQALPFVIEQRNNALDGAALCQGDLGSVQALLAAIKAELDAAKAEIDRLTKKDAPQ